MQQRLTPLQARQKIKYYCAYQERSHQEVKNKLYEFGLRKEDVEEILSELISEDYLNEERFARIFAGSKFRQKQWGKNKILHELKARSVSPYNIKVAMREIDEDEYASCLEKLTHEKWNVLKNEQYIIRETKTIRYMMQKGFEADQVKNVLKNLRGK